jgi:hypothetical protein
MISQPLHCVWIPGRRSILYAHAEVIVNAIKPARVLMARRGLSDNDRPL